MAAKVIVSRCPQARGTVVYEQDQVDLSRRAWLANDEGAGAQLSDHHQRSHERHESAQGVVSQLGHSLWRQRSICTTLSRGMARQDQRSRRPAARRTLLPTARCVAAPAPGSAAGLVAGGQEAQAVETAAADSGDWSHPSGTVGCADADAAPFPHQATTVDLLGGGGLKKKEATTAQTTRRGEGGKGGGG